MQNPIIKFGGGVGISAAASVVGKCEHEGPIGDVFDLFDTSDKFSKKTWEKVSSSSILSSSSDLVAADALIAGTAI